ncbi:MAG: hypothetical protein N2C14_15065, partial [Planctomycetales bacterium]
VKGIFAEGSGSADNVVSPELCLEAAQPIEHTGLTEGDDCRRNESLRSSRAFLAFSKPRSVNIVFDPNPRRKRRPMFQATPGGSRPLKLHP